MFMISLIIVNTYPSLTILTNQTNIAINDAYLWYTWMIPFPRPLLLTEIIYDISANDMWLKLHNMINDI